MVKVVGGSESGRSCTDDGYLLPITHDVCFWQDIPFAEGGLDDSCLVFTVCSRLVVETVQHAGLLAERRTDAACELREGIGAAEQAISQFPVSFIQGIVPFRCLIAQRTSPVAERYATVHTTACLQLTLAGAECLFHFTEVVDSILNRPVASLLSMYL